MEAKFRKINYPLDNEERKFHLDKKDRNKVRGRWWWGRVAKKPKISVGIISFMTKPTSLTENVI